MDLYILGLLIISLVSNIVLSYFLFKINSKQKHKGLDANAQEVLCEILSGPAVLKIEVIEKDSLIQWRRNH